MSNQSRRPAGTSTGGQFAGVEHSEASTSISPFTKRGVNITLADHEWQPTGPEEDPQSRLLCDVGVSINGSPMHLTAIAVDDDDSGFQSSEHHDDELDRLAAAFQPDGGWQTTEIGGRSYVLFMEGFSR